MKLSLHTAQASLRPASFEATRCSTGQHSYAECILIRSGNLAIFARGRLGCAPVGDNSGTHQATGVAHHLLFPVGGGSACWLAIRHLADVGISDPLQTGLGFFGLLKADCPPKTPAGWPVYSNAAPCKPAKPQRGDLCRAARGFYQARQHAILASAQ